MFFRTQGKGTPYYEPLDLHVWTSNELSSLLAETFSHTPGLQWKKILVGKNWTSGKLWLMCACTYKVSDSRCALVDAFWELSYKRRPFRKDYKVQLHHAARRVGLETALLCIWQGTVIKWCKELVDGVIHRQNSWIRPVCSKFVRHCSHIFHSIKATLGLPEQCSGVVQSKIHEQNYELIRSSVPLLKYGPEFLWEVFARAGQLLKSFPMIWIAFHIDSTMCI